MRAATSHITNASTRQAPPRTTLAPKAPRGAPPKKRNGWRAHDKRSYADEVLAKWTHCGAQDFEVAQYGALPIPGAVPALRRAQPRAGQRPCARHGRRSRLRDVGRPGRFAFLRTEARAFAAFNIVAPCVSPWGYEHIQRWNADVDPNRSFGPGALEGPAESRRRCCGTSRRSAIPTGRSTRPPRDDRHRRAVPTGEVGAQRRGV